MDAIARRERAFLERYLAGALEPAARGGRVEAALSAEHLAAALSAVEPLDARREV